MYQMKYGYFVKISDEDAASLDSYKAKKKIYLLIDFLSTG